MLFGEIRLYRDRIVKVRHLIGNLEMMFEDAALVGRNTGFSVKRVFSILLPFFRSDMSRTAIFG
jgi:hypothetical protein